MTASKSFALSQLLARLDAAEHVSLAPYSTLKVGGCAKYFVVANNIEDLASLQLACAEHNVALHVVSGGSNTLFSDEGFDGVVLKLGPSFDSISDTTDGLSLSVGAATSFAKVTKKALHMGWNCAVGFSGTPGLLGGAIKMNAGTRYGVISDALAQVHGLMNGQKLTFAKKDLQYSYRKSNLPPDFIIIGADLSVDINQVSSEQDLMPKVQDYRGKRKLSQPSNNSLGSFFKNPLPSFAGQLIEKCNLKGLQYKGAQISPMHANFIVNNGGASANDILKLAHTAQTAVFDKYGVLLEPEIRMVGRFQTELEKP